MAVVAKQIVVGVDDDFQVRESIERFVESAGFAPLVFSFAEEPPKLGVIAKTTYLITDVRICGMDGIELQHRLRQIHPNRPVIFFTAHYDELVRHRALDDGATDFLYKPFEATELLLSIERALQQSES
jgi:FixJ family two-component response regulator